MTNYDAGARAERSLCDAFARRGMEALRAAGSGTAVWAKCDVVIWYEGWTLPMEVKAYKSTSMPIDVKEQSEQLADLKLTFDPKGEHEKFLPLFAVKIKDKGKWRFYSYLDLVLREGEHIFTMDELLEEMREI